MKKDYFRGNILTCGTSTTKKWQTFDCRHGMYKLDYWKNAGTADVSSCMYSGGFSCHTHDTRNTEELQKSLLAYSQLEH